MSYIQEINNYESNKNISFSSSEYIHLNWKKYIDFYKDLSFMKSKKQAWEHWITHGKNENREYFFLDIDENTDGQCQNIDDKNIKMRINKYRKKVPIPKKINVLLKAYKKFDWEYYIQYYNDLSNNNNINNKISAWQIWHELKNKNNHSFFEVPSPEIINYENFDWVTYIAINTDLVSLDRKQIWYHWVNHGSKEERAFSRINTTRIHKARFGNLFLINMAFHFIAIKNNLKVSYKYYDKFKELGVTFFIGKKTFNEDFFLSDNSFLNIIKNNEKIEKNIIIDIDDFFCQTKEFCFYLRDKFKEIFTENIKKTNIFKERYNNNQDVFIHVRLGDLQNEIYQSNNKDYYDNILSVLNFEKGYISSDTIQSDFCKFLIKKYNLEIIDLDEVKTIMFASTCKNLLLSGGTFSWLMGFLAFYSERIYYPKNKHTWYDDIFVFNDWIQVNID